MSLDGAEGRERDDLDTRLLADLAHVRLHPFGDRKLAERLAKTSTLSELATQLYGPATTLSARDQHQRSLIITASKRMDGTNGEALLRLLGLTPDTSGKDRVYRHEMAGQVLWPKARAGSSFARQENWAPFLQLGVAALQEVARSNLHRGNDRQSLRDLDIPIVDRKEVRNLVLDLREGMPTVGPGRTVVFYGPPGSGAFTNAEQALARITLQNRHVIRVDDAGSYHRDLLDVLDTYGIQAETWSAAACERAFHDLLKRSPDSLGGVILHGANTADQVAHLIPRENHVPVVIIARWLSKPPWYGSEWPARMFTIEEARQILASGHPTAAPKKLDLLAGLLYRYAGLLSIAARSIVPVATLIRRLSRDRIDTALELANNSGYDLWEYARLLVHNLAENPDALIALDVALWLTGGHSRWHLYHLVGFLLPGKTSPARTKLALEQLDAVGLHSLAWAAELYPGSGPLVPLLRRLRAHRMMPLLHILTELEAPSAAVDIYRDKGTPARVPVGSDQAAVTVVNFLVGGVGIAAALFVEGDGTPHAQLYQRDYYRFYDSDYALELYEDGHLASGEQIPDVDRSNYPAVTRYMLELLGGDESARFDAPGAITVTFGDDSRPLHSPKPFFNPDNLDLSNIPFGSEEYFALFRNPYEDRDEAVDDEAGEIFG